MKNIILLITYIYLFQFSFSQKNNTSNYHSPLGISKILSSNFGELRPNHFHMGIDLKTNGRSGYNIYAIEKGFVSRIKVSPYGYGKVIYIDHPNGITSVYAHCSKFKGKIDSITKITQKNEENFAIEIFPKKNEIIVEKGEKIAISGNTGGSTAPHLHLELRDTKTGIALNPLIYGFDINDNRSPEIRGVKIYSLTKDGYQLNKSIKRQTIKNGNTYSIANNSINIPADYITKYGGIGFAFDVIDRLDAANNPCGLYGSYLLINGDTLFGQEINKIPFELTRFINTHKDYKEYLLNKSKYHKSFKINENKLPIYTVKDLGILKAKPGETFKVKYIAYDAKKNISILTFDLTINDGSINQNDSLIHNSNFLMPNESISLTKNNTNVKFDVCTSYEPMFINKENIESIIGYNDIPVHNEYEINIKNNDIKDGKHYIEITTSKDQKKKLNITYEKDKIKCKSNVFGTYELKRDTIPPYIKPKNIGKKISQNYISWKIEDKESGIKDYDLFIDGDWCLLEYDYKNKEITFTNERRYKGYAELELIILDNCGNITEWNKNVVFE